MNKATSTSGSSLSSILANALIGASGVTSVVTESHAKPKLRSRVSKSFTERARKEAGTPGLWGAAAKSIEVTIGADDLVSVSPTGTPDEVYEAQMLEYGTPDRPPRAVMRTYEAAFNEEYKIMVDGFSL